MGLFAAGCAPTANTDQYALRRSAYGMLQVGKQAIKAKRGREGEREREGEIRVYDEVLKRR